jgi:hypothetical protein
MVNGKLGDSPITDILIYNVPVFTPEVDDLVREVHALGGFDSELARLHLLHIQGYLWQLGPSKYERPDFDKDPARGVVANLKGILERERDRLRGAG